MMKHAILRFPDHPCYHHFSNTIFLTEYKGMEHGSYRYKLIKQLSGTSINSIGAAFRFHPDNLGFYTPEGAIEAFGSPENVALYNAVLRPAQLAHFHKDSHAI